MENQIAAAALEAVQALYGVQFEQKQVTLQKTKKEFTGDLTLVVFPFLKASHKNPQQTAEEIGQWLQEHVAAVAGYNVINGFLNLVLNASTWMDTLSAIDAADKYGFVEATEKSPLVMLTALSYSSSLSGSASVRSLYVAFATVVPNRLKNFLVHGCML